jgi:hypothetical protein
MGGSQHTQQTRTAQTMMLFIGTQNTLNGDVSNQIKQCLGSFRIYVARFKSKEARMKVYLTLRYQTLLIGNAKCDTQNAEHCRLVVAK